jgi:hypothetical protein
MDCIFLVVCESGVGLEPGVIFIFLSCPAGQVVDACQENQERCVRMQGPIHNLQQLPKAYHRFARVP